MGIMQPVRRDNSDFDAGLKKQIPTGSGYIRYYVSGILQFQFLKAMCPRDQLDCDLQQNENVYSRLYPMMSRGATEVNAKLSLIANFNDNQLFGVILVSSSLSYSFFENQNYQKLH